jgi:hypothetical protein
MVRRVREVGEESEERVGKEGNPMKSKQYHIQEKFATNFGG